MRNLQIDSQRLTKLTKDDRWGWVGGGPAHVSTHFLVWMDDQLVVSVL